MLNTVWREFRRHDSSHPRLGRARATLILAVALTLAGVAGCANGGGGSSSGGGNSTTPDYSLSASPSSLAVTQGAGGNSTITIIPANGFTGSVSLAASGLPSGVTAAFNSTPATSTSTLTLTASGTAAVGTTTVTITGTSGTLSHTAAVTLTVNAAPVLSTSVQTQGNFAPNQQNASYQLLVFNAPGSGSTSGTVTVTDPPTGFTIVSVSGTGWVCVLGTPPLGFTCTRSDSLPGGASFPAINVFGNVTLTAGHSVSIPASVSGGGALNPSNSSSSVSVAAPILSIAKSHTGNFFQGQQGAPYTITVSNQVSTVSVPVGPTDGTVVTVKDDLASAPGLTLASISGAGWSCVLGTATCTRTDSLAAGQSYPITVTVNVAANAVASQINKASLTTGGGSVLPPTVNDPTAVAAPPTISKAFGAPSVALNGSTSLTFTVTNPAANTVALAGVAFTDSLPAGLVVATPNGLANTCSGTPSALAGSGTVSLTGGSLAVNSSCTLTVNVNGATAGTKNNVTGNVAATNGGTGTTGSASLNVIAPPTFTENFGGATVALNTSTSLTFNLGNPNTANSLSGIGFTDSLPAGLVVSTPNGLSNTCNGTPAAVAASGSVSLTGGTLAANGSCTLTVNVTATGVGAKTNLTGNITSTEGGTGTTATANLAVVAPPTITKSYSPTSINPNANTTVTFTITNPAANTVALHGLAFSDSLSSGVQVAASPGLTNTCAGTPSATGGATTISLTGGTLAVNSSCTLTVNVTGTSTGVNLPNTTGTISSTEGGTGATSNTANLDVAAPPTISKAFGAASIPLNTSTSMTFTITNPAGNAFSLSGLAFTDSLPAGLIVATPNGLSNTCAGTATAAAGSSSVSLSGGTVAATSSCTFTVNVQGTAAGAKANTTGVITSTESGAGATSNTANLTVEAPPQITESFSPQTIALNSASTLTITITNPAVNTAAQSGVAFTNTLAAGLVVATPNGLGGTCVGTTTAVAGSSSVTFSGGNLGINASCTVTVNIQATTAGALTNATGAVSSTNGGTGLAGNTANLTAVAPPTISKAFNPLAIPLSTNSALTFTIANPAANTVAVTGVTFSDALPAGLVVATPNGLSSTCGGTPTATAGAGAVSLSGATLAINSSCTLTVNVRANSAGTLANTTGTISSNESGSGATSNTANLSVATPPTISKAFGAPSVQLNTATSLTFTIANPVANTSSLTGISFVDALPAGLVVATPNGLANNTCGVIPTAVAGSSSVSLSAATLAVNTSCSFAVNVTGSTAGPKLNTTGAISSNESGAGATSNTATLTVIGPPLFTKAFGAASIPVNGVTSLTFSISNPNTGSALSGIGFTDSLPAGLLVASPNGLTSTCGGTATAVAGSGSVSLAGGTLTANGSCTVVANVTASVAGAANNLTTNITSTEGGNGTTASASLNVVAPPTISKAFSPTAIALNANSTVTFTITNSAGNTVGLNGIAFSDSLTSGLVVATTPGIGGTCNGTPTAVAGTGTISLAGATLAVNTSCTLTVNVKGTSAGTLPNTTGAVSSTNGGTGSASNTANLTVTAAPTISKAFGAGSIALSTSTSLTFTITNPAANAGSLTGIAFTDNLPAGLVVATPNGLANNTCSVTPTAVAGSGSVSLSAATLTANTSCSFAVNVTGTTAGAKANTTNAISSTESGAGATSNTANLTVVGPPQLTKAFGTQNLVLNGSTSLTFTVTNPNTTAGLTGLAFTDTLPAGLVVSTPNGLTGSCPSGVITAAAGSGSVSLSGAALGAALSCNFAVNVKGISNGAQNNTTSVIASNEGGNGTAATASVTVVTIAPPQFSKNFGLSSIPVNGSTTLTFNISNQNPSNSLSGIGFTDTFPSGLTLAASTPLASNTCNVAPTAVAGSGSVSLSGAALAANASCSIVVNVTGATTGLKNNTTTNITSTEAGNGGTANASVTVVGPPLLSKSFGAPSIPVNGSTSLTFQIANPNSVSLTGVSFTDTLPTGMVVSTPNGLTNTCGGTATAVAGSGSVTLSGATLAFGPPCNLVVNVTSSVAGAKNNTTSAISSNEGGSGAAANATLNVYLPPQFTKNFGVSSIPLNGSTTLTFNISNPNAGTSLTGISFTDNFPAGLLVSTPNGLTTSCGGTATAVAGSGSVTLSGGTVAASNGCSIVVNVTANLAAPKNNLTNNITSNEGGSGTTASASLNVLSPPQFTKNFGVASIGANGTTTLTFNISNPNSGTALTGVSFIDSLPAGLVVSTPNGLTDSCSLGATATAGSGSVSLSGATLAANAACSVVVNVTATTGGVKNNTTNNITSNEGGNGPTANASLNVTGAPQLTKNFGVPSIVVNGSTTLSFNLTNPNAGTSLTGVSFTDTFPAGLVLTGTPLASNTCGGTPTATAGAGSASLSGVTLAASASCSLVVNVTATTGGVKNNTTSTVSSNEAGSGAAANASLTVVAPPQFTKSFGVGSIAAGASTTLTFNLSNPNPTTPLTGVGFTDPFPSGLVLSGTPVQSNNCGVTPTAVAGTGTVSLSAVTLGGSGSCTLVVNVTGTAVTGLQNNTTTNITSNEAGNGPQATASITVTAGADLLITNSDGTTTTTAFSITTYTVRVTNNGPSSVTGAVLRDPPAGGLSKTTVVCSATPGQCTGPTTPSIATLESAGGFSLPTLASGQFYEILIPASVTATSGSVTNSASVTAPGGTTDPNGSNNNASDTDTLPTGPFTMSGTVTYTGGQVGIIYIRVYQSGCTTADCQAVAGTTIAGPGAWSISGIQTAGTYVVNAEVDALGTGIQSAQNPSCYVGNACPTVNLSSNTSSITVPVTNATAAAAQQVTNLQVSGGDPLAVVQYDAPTNANKEEIATSYKVYWGPSAVSLTSSKTFAAQGTNQNVFFLSGTNGGLTAGSYFFAISAIANGVESAQSAAFGPVTVGAQAGNHTVSGTVTFNPTTLTPTGPLYVGVFNGSTGAVYSQEIMNPVNGQIYSITGVPDGIYQNFFVLDNNYNNGTQLPGVGEGTAGNPNNINNNNTPTVVVSGADYNNANLTLSGAVATPLVTTFHSQFNGTSEFYNLQLRVNWGTKRPVAVRLTSGPNVGAPWDFPVDNGTSVSALGFPNGTVPHVGDTYHFSVTFSDGSGPTDFPASVTGVVNTLPQSLLAQTTAPGTQTAPLFTWSDTGIPASDSYKLSVGFQLGGSVWQYPGHDSGSIPNLSSALYNSDGRASSPNLTIGNTYFWSVLVSDPNGNVGTQQSTYTPGGPVLSSLVVTPNAVVAGSGASAVLTLSGTPPSGGAEVALFSNDTAVTPQINTIFIASPATSFTVPLSTAAGGTLPRVVNITAIYNNVTITQPLTLEPAGTLLISSVTFPVVNIVGGDTLNNIKVNLNRAVTAGDNGGAAVTVNLSTSNGSLANPASGSVSVSVGQSASSNFSVTSSSVSAATPVGITAALVGTASGTLTLQPSVAITAGQVLPLGAALVSYPANTSVARSGGLAPFTFSLTTGALPSGMNPIGSGNGLISGTPSAATTQPTPDFTVKVVDTVNPNVTALTPHSATQVLSIQVDNPSVSNPCLNLPAGYSGSESMLNGSYAGFLQGFKGGGAPGTPVALAFSFLANGTGGITGGAVDIDSTSHTQYTVSSVANAYTVSSTGLGCMTLNLTSVPPGSNATATFHFVLGGTAAHGATAGIASTGRIMEFDDYSGSGNHVSGILRRQDTTAFSTPDTTHLQTRYTIGLDGVDFGGGHFAFGGSLSLDPATGILGGSGGASENLFDLNDNGSVQAGITGVTGSITSVSSTTGRGVISVTSSLGTYNYAAYIVNTNELLMVATDTFSASFPVHGGRSIAYNASALPTSPVSVIFHETGINNSQSNGNSSCTSSTPCADATLGIVSVTPTNSTSGGLSGSVTNAEAGFANTNGFSLSYLLDTVTGRETNQGGQSVSYLVTAVSTGASGDTEPITFFSVGATGDNLGLFGIGEPQPTGPYSNSSLSGNFIFANEDAGQNASYQVIVGLGSFSSGVITPSRDRSGPNGLFLNSAGTPFNFTINSDGSVVGVNGTSAIGVTNGNKLFEFGPNTSPARIATFEKQ